MSQQLDKKSAGVLWTLFKFYADEDTHLEGEEFYIREIPTSLIQSLHTRGRTLYSSRSNSLYHRSEQRRTAKFLWYIYKYIRGQIRKPSLDEKSYPIQLRGSMILSLYTKAGFLYKEIDV